MDLAAGQRVFSGLLYLNAGFDGGETEFPRLNISFPPRRGSLLFWRNVGFDMRPDPRTVHRARPVKAGQKLACNMWVLQRTFDLYRGL